MKEKFLFLALAIIFVPAISLAQNVADVVDSSKVDPYEDMIIEIYDNEDGVEVRDTIYLNNPADNSVNVVQLNLKECDSVDVCENHKYAVVTKNGKKGIYDIMLNQLVTAVEFDELGFSCRKQIEGNAFINIFYTKKDNKEGMLSVLE